MGEIVKNKKKDCLLNKFLEISDGLSDFADAYYKACQKKKRTDPKDPDYTVSMDGISMMKESVIVGLDGLRGKLDALEKELAEKNQKDKESFEKIIENMKIVFDTLKSDMDEKKKLSLN
jgi:hypothetical protein